VTAVRVTFCGVRGSTAAPGADFVRYGGRTSCVALSAGGDPDLLLDAGTGLCGVTDLLGGRPFRGSVLLTHLHWDHTHGLPFFRSGTDAQAVVQVLLPEQGTSAETVMERAFSPPHFPVTPSALGPGWGFDGIEPGRRQVAGWEVLARDVPHPGGRTYGYRVERDGVSVAYLPDHSPTTAGPGPDGLGARHEAALELADQVDLLVHDATHVAREFPGVAHLGHSSVEYAVALAEQSGARRLALFHHDPARTDDQLDEIARAVTSRRVTVVAAYEGLVLDLDAWW
jgi:phosphoribosyl 1,2-cyclic phosphodiesterase